MEPATSSFGSTDMEGDSSGGEDGREETATVLGFRLIRSVGRCSFEITVKKVLHSRRPACVLCVSPAGDHGRDPVLIVIPDYTACTSRSPKV